MALANKNIFLVTNSNEERPEAFSNIGTALDFVRDSHGDLNAEGSALVLETGTGSVPATNKAVKDRNYSGRTLHFSASDADAASVVAATSSKLDGAIQACVGLGIDPANVARVVALRVELESAQLKLEDSNSEDSVTFAIQVLRLHKRKHNKKATS